MKVEFKTPQVQAEYENASLILRLLAEDFIRLSNNMGIIPTVTRVLETIPGSSGVHEDSRAIDFRDEHQGRFLYTDEQIKWMLGEINTKWARNDNKPTMIHHSFQGAPYHIHLQIATLTKTYTKAKV